MGFPLLLLSSELVRGPPLCARFVARVPTHEKIATSRVRVGPVVSSQVSRTLTSWTQDDRRSRRTEDTLENGDEFPRLDFASAPAASSLVI